jgi:hypothetical protein
MNKILTKLDTETSRTPSALAAWYYTKYEEIRSDQDERGKVRLRQGLYKYFVQEIYPLMLYSRWRFPQDGVLCQPRIGSQGYDATICPIDQPGYVYTVEVTYPQDGEEHNAVAELMNRHGFHGRVGDEVELYNQDIIQRALSAANKKSVNDYRTQGGSALLIVLDTRCSPLEPS